jgi:hypothetical protein
MLAVIIPTVWLAVAMFVVMLCRMAARSDASAARLGACLVEEHASAAPVTITLGRRPQPWRSGSCRVRPRRSYIPQCASHGGRQRA